MSRAAPGLPGGGPRRIVSSMSNDLDLYVIRRRGAWDSPEELQEAAALSAHVGDLEMPADIRWIRSYVVTDENGQLGTVCIYQASSPEKIREHAERAGLPVDEVVPVVDTVLVRADPQPAAA